MDLPNPYLVHHLRLAPLLMSQAQRQSRGPPASHQGDQALSRHHVPTLVVPYFGAGYGREELLEQALQQSGVGEEGGSYYRSEWERDVEAC